MASNDWKTELKRRIEDIKEKKKQDSKTAASTSKTSIKEEVQKSIAMAQKKKAEDDNVPEPEVPSKPKASATTPPPSPVRKQEAKVEAWPKTRHNLNNPPETPEKKDSGRKFAGDLFLKTEEDNSSADPLFQIDTDASEENETDRDARREAEIRRALANASNKPARNKSRTNQGDTLFPIDLEDEPKFKVADKRQRINISDLSFVDEPQQQRPQPANRSVMQKNEEEPTLEESLQSIDKLMDSYVPVSPVEPDDEEPLIRRASNIDDDRFFEEEELPEDKAPRNKGLSKPIVLDKAYQHRNLLRIGAGLTDLIILASIEALLIWIASMILKTTPLDIFFSSLLPLGALFLILHFIYYMLFMSVTGQTPGKSLFQLKVVNKSGNSLGFGRSFFRWVLQVICLAPAALGFFFMFVSPKGHTLYDMMLGTRLVRQENDDV